MNIIIPNTALVDWYVASIVPQLNTW